MKSILKCACTFALLLTLNSAKSQNTKTAVKTLLNADSLASGNFKDVLSSFFRLSFDNLTGKSKQFNFASNPYAILLKTNPNAALDINYPKYRHLRKLNFSFGLNLDTGYNFNGFSSGIKYALIDERDATISKMLRTALFNGSLYNELDELQYALNDYLEENIPNTPENYQRRLDFNQTLDDFFSSSTIAFKDLDPSFKDLVRKLALDKKRFKHLPNFDTAGNAWSLRQETDVRFQKMKEPLKNNLLWTVSISDTTYKNQFIFSNLLLKTELLKGLGKPKPGANWEFNIQAALNFVDDTTSASKDLKRSIFNFEPGLNLVLRGKDTEKSFMELKFSGEYSHNFNKLYLNEKRDQFTFNGTIRLKLFNEIWLPLEFKYDPDKGNVLGFISAKFNFSALAKAAK